MGFLRLFAAPKRCLVFAIHLAGGAGWHRADSQKPELMTMGRAYDDSLDSARIYKPQPPADEFIG